jgi:hypothetical protein
MEIRPSMILISCVFGLISMVAIGDMVSPADADYDFTLEKSIPGIRDLGCILISPDNESACIIANDKTYIYEFSSKSFIAQREFDDRYFRSGAWLEDGIILTTGPLLPPPIPAPPPITVLSPNDLSIKAQHSIESGSLFIPMVDTSPVQIVVTFGYSISRMGSRWFTIPTTTRRLSSPSPGTIRGHASPRQGMKYGYSI